MRALLVLSLFVAVSPALAQEPAKPAPKRTVLQQTDVTRARPHPTFWGPEFLPPGASRSSGA